ncbi:MAG: rhomboid family intramembrane serine protease [Bacteroidota bacterium]
MLNRLTPAVKNLIIINVIIFIGFGIFSPRLDGVREVEDKFFSIHKSNLLGFRSTAQVEFLEVYTPFGAEVIMDGRRRVIGVTSENIGQVKQQFPYVESDAASRYRKSTLSGPERFQPIQLVSWAFNHGDFWHIFFNMFIFFLIGPAVEHILGTERFLKFYFFCAIFGGLLIALLDPANNPVLGASGAIYGVMVAFALFFPREKFYFYFLIPIEARWFVTGIGVFSLIMVVRNLLGLGGGDNISHFGHLAGMVAAFVFFYLGKAIPFLGK